MAETRVQPVRIQMSRRRPWRAGNPEAVIVARPSKWGNPFRVGETLIRVPGLRHPWEYEGRLGKRVGEREFFRIGTDDRGMPVGCWHEVRKATAAQCVELFRLRVTGADVVNVGHDVGVDEIRSELAGRNLACWCRPDQPCHADVLLDIANSAGDEKENGNG